MTIRFEWDPAKAQSNLRKHGIDFASASRVFDDPLHLSVQDRVDDKTGEARWITFGLVDESLIVAVAHTVREGDHEVIRIISARRATKQERQRYEQS